MTRPGPRRWVPLVVVSLVVVSLVGALLAVESPADAASASPLPAVVSARSVSPIGALPVGAAPVGIPYGIGKRLYLNGVAYDLSARWTALATSQAFGEFTTVTVSRGVVVFSIGQHQIDPAEVVGTLRPGVSVSRIASSPSFGLAVTSGGLVTTGTASDFQPTVPIVTLAGAAYPPPFTDPLPADPFYAVAAQGAGGSFVFQAIDPSSAKTAQSYRQYPGYPAVRLNDDTYGVGGGTGWVATFESIGGSCFRTAALASAATLRARICSQTMPLVSADGTEAVVVQGNHVRLYDTRTGAQIDATNAPTLSSQTTNTPVNGYFPFAWESATSYLVYAKDGTSLYILRCSVDRTCRRAVTSAVRTGVSEIAVRTTPL